MNTFYSLEQERM